MDGPNLLVVDDDRSNCAIICRTLAVQGYHVDEAFDGVSALGLIERTSCELAVLDYEMPGMNGVELFAEIVARQPRIMVVFLTGFKQFNTMHPAIIAGGTPVLGKPVDFTQLLRLIEDLVGKPMGNVRNTNGGV